MTLFSTKAVLNLYYTQLTNISTDMFLTFREIQQVPYGRSLIRSLKHKLNRKLLKQKVWIRSKVSAIIQK